MFTQLKKVPALLFALVALVAVSCNTNDGPVDPGSKPGTPTALKAQSRSATSVGLKWDAPASGVTPSGYRIYYNVKGSATKVPVEVPGATATSEVVTGLTAGTMYEFTVQSLNGSVVGDATAALTWAPAYRTSATTPIKLYSSLSANGSGLVVFDGNPRAEKINKGDLWDLAYDDKFTPARPKIASPGWAKGYVDTVSGVFLVSGLVSRITYLGRLYTNVNNLDDIFETEHLNDPTLAFEKESDFDLSSPAGTGGIAFVFANKNDKVAPNTYTYGKVLVKRTGGTIIQGSDPDKYIEVVVSYQTTVDVPYALKAKLDALESQATVRQATVRQANAR